MRIAYVAGAAMPSPKASTIQVMMMCQAMARLGHAVTLFTPSHQSSVISHQSADDELRSFYGVEPIFKIRRIGRGAGREGSALFLLRSVVVARLGRRDVCYARGRGWMAAIAAHSLGAQVVYEAHGLPASPREAWAVAWLARSRRVRIVVISGALRQKYCDLGIVDCGSQFAIRNSQFRVAPDGVDLCRFKPPLERGEARRLCGLPLDKKLVIYAGGLYAGHGLEELVEALAGTEAVLVLVGGGDEVQFHRVRDLALARGAKVVFMPCCACGRFLYKTAGL